MKHRLLAALLFGTFVSGCGYHSTVKPSAKKPTAQSGAATCRIIGPSVLRFGESLEDVEQTTKNRIESYAGMLELLLTFEHASVELERDLANVPAQGDLANTMARARQALGEGNQFAKTARVRAEKAIERLGAPAKETSTAYKEVRAICPAPEGKGEAPKPSAQVVAPPKKPKPKAAPKVVTPARSQDCTSLDEVLGKFSGAPLADHTKIAQELLETKVSDTSLAQAKDRAANATIALAKILADEQVELQKAAKGWVNVQKSIGQSFETFAAQCKDAPLENGQEKLIADTRPDPRKLTVLVRARPPQTIEDSLERLASSASDETERAFYMARSKGAFGSGFVIVRQTASGAPETLVITNRHVVDLSDRVTLELADGTTLGPAEIYYTDPLQDVAVLRPSKKQFVDRGFAFATAPAKDQQGVVATGFPGMAGRPSYQTTRGYISNESFKLDDGPRSLTYVQHTAPIDPGSSGGPLTDDKGNVLGLNTLKVTNREAVGLAVPSASILETIRRADAAEAHRTVPETRKGGARLACLAFVGELAAKKPRTLALETMVTHDVTGEEGIAGSSALADDPDFGRLWQSDTVRALRIGAVLRVQSNLAQSGGFSALETCADVTGDGKDEVRYRVRVGSGETRDLAVRFEQGNWKVSHVDLPVSILTGAVVAEPKGGAAKKDKPAAPAKPAAKKKKPAAAP